MDERERAIFLESRREVSSEEAMTDNDDEAAVVMQKVNLIDQGFKMLDIIGQIRKNYYGSLSEKDKYTLCEELFKLGLRINYSFIGDLRDNNKLLVEYIFSSEKFGKMRIFFVPFNIPPEFVYQCQDIKAERNRAKI